MLHASWDKSTSVWTHTPGNIDTVCSALGGWWLQLCRGSVLLLDGNVGLGGVPLVVLELAKFGGGVRLVAGEETVTAEGPCSTVTEKPREKAFYVTFEPTLINKSCMAVRYTVHLKACTDLVLCIPVMPDKLDVVTSVTGFDAVHTNGIAL